LRPDVVLAHDPWRRWRLHPDHRAAGFLACDGIVGARDPHFYPEHELAHHRPSTLLLFETEEPNHFEDVTGYAEQKVDALLAHESQHESTMFIVDDDRSQRDAFVRRIVDDLVETGRAAGVEHAESFRRIDEL
jgi:LmbE family N-acetylglucosaminyl deacetylase